METNKTLAEDFGGERVVSNGYGGFMEGLLQLVEGKEIGAPLGEQIKAYALGFVEEHDLGGFNRFSDETYVRDYIGRDAGTGWEAIVMCWKKGNRTAIHSHPQFAGYTFADGEFLVEIFEPRGTGAHPVQQLHIPGQLGLYAIGEAGKFTNHIHRITCLSKTAHSLHIYSDDALKGLKYEEV